MRNDLNEFLFDFFKITCLTNFLNKNIQYYKDFLKIVINIPLVGLWLYENDCKGGKMSLFIKKKVVWILLASCLLKGNSKLLLSMKDNELNEVIHENGL